MILKLQQYGWAALLFSLLISCSPDGDVGHVGLANQKSATNKKEDISDTNTLDNDVKFAELVAENGLLEVQLAALSINKSSSDTIKRFAVSMMTDHTVFNSELQQIVELKDITLPHTLSQKSQKKYNELAGKSGHEFDEAYCAFLVRERQEVVLRFKEEAESGNDPELKEWAARKIVALEQLLASAKTLHAHKE
ncbi:MAG: hypothetical protein C0490_02125 [Marivirga sp.]|nr:hypothetical protein [Marivirga sp.]